MKQNYWDSDYKSSNGLHTYVKAGESAETIILWLHGYTLNSTLWPELWAMYPEATHVAIDLPAHGNSASFNKFGSLTELADDIADIATHHSCKHIAGFSFGGLISLQIVIQHPELFNSISLISSPVGGQLVDPETQLRNQQLIKLFKEKGKGPWLTDLWLQSPPDIFTGLKKHPEAFAKIKLLVDEHAWTELAHNDFSLLAGVKQNIASLKTNNTEFFLYVGDEDMPYIKRCNELLLRSVKNGKRFYIPDCGHLPILENPSLVMSMIKENLRIFQPA